MSDPFWSLSIEDAFRSVGSRREGLNAAEAGGRLKKFGPNSLHPPRRSSGLILFVSQFKSPLILLLLGAAALSFALGDSFNAIIIAIIVGFSALLGFFQEYGAVNALEKMMKLIEINVAVIRDGKEEKIALHKVVVGDVVQLSAGDAIPGDCLLIDAHHLFVDESTLTGESMAAEKAPGAVSAEASQAERTGALFMGTSVMSGTALALVMATAKNTEFGKIADRTRFHPPETAFEVGVRKFGYFLLWVTLILVVAIFGFNLYFKRPFLDALLFSLAIAVGLTPQLLPAIISVNLAHGARKMAKKRVIVKRLASIENFGQMNVLCADKTGTITEGKLQFVEAVDALGGESGKCRLYGFLNAHFQKGYTNPLDFAIQNAISEPVDGWEKVDEVPYDFGRKRVSVVFEREGKTLLIAKGAVHEMLSVCSEIEWKGGDVEPLTEERRQEVEIYCDQAGSNGFRSIAVGYCEGGEEKNLRLLGFFHFLDPLKERIGDIIRALKQKGVHLKMITGDSRIVAMHVTSPLGMTHAHLATGQELKNVSDEELVKLVKEKNIFAEIEPNQKERIILALRKAGCVVGYLGDGINDVSALHSADVGISVNTGAPAAKEASDFVMLDKHLSTLLEGIKEGRQTFANTIKYVYMATSANFGNMFSMAGASLFLSFLPMLPKQVLLTNLMTDFPEMAIASDSVDEELVHKPVKWDLKFIRHFMIVFGLISSIFDYLTFGVLLLVFHASEDLFRTGWFVESVATAALVVLLIRTRHWCFSSRPGTLLMIAVFGSVAAAAVLPMTPLGPLFGFTPLPGWFYGVIAAIVVSYLTLVEVAKRFFFKR